MQNAIKNIRTGFRWSCSSSAQVRSQAGDKRNAVTKLWGNKATRQLCPGLATASLRGEQPRAPRGFEGLCKQQHHMETRGWKALTVRMSTANIKFAQTKLKL